jgi:hypothetical protein
VTPQLGRLRSGQIVVDRYRSHNHLATRPLLPEVLGQIYAQGRQFIHEEVDFGRIVGLSTCVVTGPGDEIVYAQRPGRRGPTRFVKNRQPEPSSAVTVILKKDDFEDYYVLITAFIGNKPEPEPWDRHATEKSRGFWASHALIWGSEPVVPGTETTVCPW